MLMILSDEQKKIFPAIVFCGGMSIANPLADSLMSKLVPANEQGTYTLMLKAITRRVGQGLKIDAPCTIRNAKIVVLKLSTLFV